MADEFDNELEELGKRLRALRKARNLRLLDMEVLSGIQDSKLSRIERGLENIEFHTIFKLAKALQVKVIELFDYDGPLPDNANFKNPLKKRSKKRR
ncbi:MAG: XRE family transcriptional regulator [Chryseobacterium sp.]|nr:MAG: XRE family transcriptional regulator [Chryseobacterium sp.]